jgi:hypothetical protein
MSNFYAGPAVPVREMGCHDRQLGLAFGPSALKMWWLLMSCLWPVVWIEWARISIRRKLPVAEWPKQLYL